MNHSIGSLWSKWDLHVHTPASIVNWYGGNNDSVWEKYISDLENLPQEFKVIGINDYNFIDGYKKVLDFRKNGRLTNIELFLPILELRINRFASQGSEAWKKLNLHIIFSNKVSPEHIENYFLNSLRAHLKLSPDTEQEFDFQTVPTIESMEELGKKIKETSNIHINDSDREVGFKNLTYDYEKVFEALKDHHFHNKYLIAIGKAEWDKLRWDGSAADKKTLINNADFIFTSLPKASTYQHQKDKLTAQKVNDLLLDCSDAHHFSNEFNQKDRIGNSSTWIKAIPSFEGLKQVKNDHTRVFIGDLPELLERQKSDSTKFIKSLKVYKSRNGLDEKWFDNFNLNFNPSLVAIIGNKGQGKSAIADILGLLGNSTNHEHSSFLTKEKFRRGKHNKSSFFSAEIEWQDGSRNSLSLDKPPSAHSVERVKYLPQHYLEKLCNGQIEDFENELRNVIFSHLTDEKKLEKTSLNDLIDHKSKLLNQEIGRMKLRLSELNRKISTLEDQSTEDQKAKTESLITAIQERHEAHQRVKPKQDLPESSSDDKTDTTKLQLIANLRNQVQESEAKAQDRRKHIIKLAKEKDEIEHVNHLIEEFVKKYEVLKQDITPTLEQHSILIDDVISISQNPNKLRALIDEKTKDIEDSHNLLNDQKGSGLLPSIDKLKNDIAKHSDELNERHKKHQLYLDALKKWEDQDKEIQNELAESKSQLNFIETELPMKLEASIESRLNLSKEIHGKKMELVWMYRDLFAPVTHFIKTYKEDLKKHSITLDVDFRTTDFQERFFNMINLGSKGSFQGSNDGRRRLNSILEEHNLNHDNGIESFLKALMKNLNFDQRSGNQNEPRDIQKQLRSGYDKPKLYDFLFGLDYLVPQYKLKLGHKSLSELSPGERGAILLIFYLVVDRDNIPLIIDQPEENLDNQSVFKVLVNFIIQAKNRRQVIMVTHNPNLAVACNAEQIIHLSMEKENGNLILHKSGALESKDINNAVVDILEGTYPALKTRTGTYDIISR